MPPLNGKTKVGISIAAVVAMAAAIFTAGGSYRAVTSHADVEGIHETGEQMHPRIDERVRLHLNPIEVKLNEMDKKIDRLLDERRTP